ncbi:MAG: cellulose binding domain-containing protein [Pseudomonadota bacterium]
MDGLIFDYPGEIVNICNARIVSRVGDRYVVENMPYNANVGAGSSTEFGFQGARTSSDITTVSINGDAFDDAGGEPAPHPAHVPKASISDATGSEEGGSLSFRIDLSSASEQTSP